MSAAITAAVVVAGASAYSANKAKQDAKGAAGAANALTQGQVNQNRFDMAPWRTSGGASINMLSYLMGLTPKQEHNADTFDSAAYLKANPDVAANAKYGANPWSHYQEFGQREGRQAYWLPEDTPGGAGSPYAGMFGSLAQPFSADKFQKDPGYDFRMQEGMKALERSGAARGMSLSGAQLKGLDRYNQDFASNEYQNAYGRYNNDQTNLFNRLSGIAGSGQQANQFTGTMGMNGAQNMGNNMMNYANYSGAANMAQANAFGNAVNTGYNNWNSNNQWNEWLKSQGKG